MAKRKNSASQELRRIYDDARKDGIWLQEFAAPAGFMAAAGEMSLIKKLEKKIGRKIDISKLEIGDCVNVAFPGIGDTREEACTAAIASLRSQRPKKKQRR